MKLTAIENSTAHRGSIHALDKELPEDSGDGTSHHYVEITERTQEQAESSANQEMCSKLVDKPPFFDVSL